MGKDSPVTCHSARLADSSSFVKIKPMRGKHTTTDDLARMIQENVVTKMVTKDDMESVRSDMKTGLRAATERLDRIENLLLRDHLNRIERLEDSIRAVKTKVGMP